MDLGIGGKVAVVTGGGRGIGAETARMLAGERVKVVVSDIDRRWPSRWRGRSWRPEARPLPRAGTYASCPTSSRS